MQIRGWRRWVEEGRGRAQEDGTHHIRVGRITNVEEPAGRGPT